jgi:hypothetical protein
VFRFSRAQNGKVGIDVEWKPDTGILPNVVSVLQMSTDDQVYVFDVKALKDSKVFVDGLSRLLADENLVKIGKWFSPNLEAKYKYCTEVKSEVSEVVLA